VLVISHDVDREVECAHRCINRPRAVAMERQSGAVVVNLQSDALAIGSIPGRCQLV